MDTKTQRFPIPRAQFFIGVCGVFLALAFMAREFIEMDKNVTPQELANYASNRCVTKYIKNILDKTPELSKRDLELVVSKCANSQDTEQLL